MNFKAKNAIKAFSQVLESIALESFTKCDKKSIINLLFCGKPVKNLFQ